MKGDEEVVIFIIFGLGGISLGTLITPDTIWSMTSMTKFEVLQIITGAVQSLILLATLFAAVYIGLKQAGISKLQATISARQTEISKDLAELPYIVSVEVTYEKSKKQLNIHNKGQTNLYLWGTKLGDGRKSVEEEPRLIAPTGFYYLLADSLESETFRSIGSEVEMRRILELYVTSLSAAKYVISTIIFAKINNGIVSIHTQTTSIKQQDW